MLKWIVFSFLCLQTFAYGQESSPYYDLKSCQTNTGHRSEIGDYFGDHFYLEKVENGDWEIGNTAISSKFNLSLSKTTDIQGERSVYSLSLVSESDSGLHLKMIEESNVLDMNLNPTYEKISHIDIEKTETGLQVRMRKKTLNWDFYSQCEYKLAALSEAVVAAK